MNIKRNCKAGTSCRNLFVVWEIEFRDENGDWFMEISEGTRKEVWQKYRNAGYTPIKIRPKGLIR